jgi:hypothetical protein
MLQMIFQLRDPCFGVGNVPLNSPELGVARWIGLAIIDFYEERR